MQTIPATHIDLHLQLTVETPEYTDHLGIENSMHVFRHAAMIFYSAGRNSLAPDCPLASPTPIMNAGLPDGQPLARAGQPKRARGKSGLHRTTCRLTAGGARSKRALRKVPQKTIPPGGQLSGKGEKVR